MKYIFDWGVLKIVRHSSFHQCPEDVQRAQDVQSGSRAQDSIATMRSAFLQSQKGKKRPVLRRVSSAPSNSPSEVTLRYPVAMDETEKPAATTTRTSVTWFDESAGVAKRMGKDSTDLTSTGHRISEDGFAIFDFDDDAPWLSDVPALRLEGVPKPSQPSRKRPATASIGVEVVPKPFQQTRKRPATASIAEKAEKKRVFSRGYHREITKYKQECAKSGKAVDENEMRERARAAGASATAYFC